MSRVEGEAGRRRSLEEVHGSVPPPAGGDGWWKRLFVFMGPAYLVSVGYMDPGNWATDLEGGARFGYALLWVLAMSNVMAVLLQTLSARLGVVTGYDLAQACRAEYSKPVARSLWVLAEVAIAATDLAEVIGTIIALKLLFHIPMLAGCLITALDTFLLLALQRAGIRKLEAVVLALVATVGICFFIQIVVAGPDLRLVWRGFWPSLPIDETGTSDRALFVAIGILGATVMPHNLYLHSALVQSRRIGPDTQSKRQACRFNLIDSAIALNAAFLVNAAILILAGTTFHHGGEMVDSIERAYELLPQFLLSDYAPILFGVALLCAGQSSTLTGTLTGQIVMEGFLELRITPWLRRLVTRLIALLPAVLVLLTVGESGTQELLVASQVVLSLQLSFAVIPLIQFTSNRLNMKEFANPTWVKAAAWLTAAIIVGLNAKYLASTVWEVVPGLVADGFSAPADGAWRRWGSRVGLVLLVPTLIATVGLLGWVILKPWVRPSRQWTDAAPLELDWSDALRPRVFSSIAVALEHSPADAEIVSQAIALLAPGPARLVLLHVADTPLTELHGADTADRHTEADELYLAEVVRGLRDRGHTAEPVLLHGADRAASLAAHLKKDPVDLLVVGSHGHRLLSDVVFGQTVDRVRHRLEIPMLIARPGPAGPDAVPTPAGPTSA